MIHLCQDCSAERRQPHCKSHRTDPFSGLYHFLPICTSIIMKTLERHIDLKRIHNLDFILVVTLSDYCPKGTETPWKLCVTWPLPSSLCKTSWNAARKKKRENESSWSIRWFIQLSSNQDSYWWVVNYIQTFKSIIERPVKK